MRGRRPEAADWRANARRGPGDLESECPNPFRGVKVDSGPAVADLVQLAGISKTCAGKTRPGSTIWSMFRLVDLVPFARIVIDNLGNFRKEVTSGNEILPLANSERHCQFLRRIDEVWILNLVAVGAIDSRPHVGVAVNVFFLRDPPTGDRRARPRRLFRCCVTCGYSSLRACRQCGRFFHSFPAAPQWGSS